MKKISITTIVVFHIVLSAILCGIGAEPMIAITLCGWMLAISIAYRELLERRAENEEICELIRKGAMNDEVCESKAS